jgi:PEP-CTERM motif
MNKRFAMAGLIAFAVLLLNVSTSYADTITATQPGADDGFGSTYVLSANCTGSVCDVTLTIHSSGANQPDISAVDFKIGSKDAFAGSVAPPNGTWNTSSGPISNGGCGGNGAGFVCSQAASTASFAATGGDLTWSWTGVTVSGDVVLGHVGYKYDNATGSLNGHIVSDSSFGGGGGSSVPEPGVLQLLGVGLVGLGVMRRRLLTF